MQTYIRSTRLLAAAFCVVFAWIAPVAEVQASCGDYLHTKHSSPTGTSSTAAMPTASAEADQQANPEEPCSGPGCQQDRERPSLPFAPPTLRIEKTSHAAVTTQHGAELQLRNGLIAENSDDRARSGYPEPNDRPPQA